MLRPTLIGGGVLGAVGGIPIVGMLNCACCALIIGGGFLAAYLYSNDCKLVGAPFGAMAGATVGLIAGAFYALAHSIVGAIANVVVRAMGFGGDIRETIEQLEDQGVEIPLEAEPWIEFLASASPFVLIAFGFLFLLLFGAVFSTIGGLIGGAVFKYEPPAAGPSAPASGAPPMPPSEWTEPPSGS
jgi:hypothetical protein